MLIPFWLNPSFIIIIKKKVSLKKTTNSGSDSIRSSAPSSTRLRLPSPAPSNLHERDLSD
ncbi:hypothetical protein QJS04_geneDACA015085 [Acorus gramineus]|uniref:Uncharacterized protein n=1 Tax=Acorus gramineus TaxID=55184 RepID=A0AAV9BXD3_ACOGR|nr:hypothetical protein QJS04_geneDACA015085 [Acorus gramineus]